jgi:hypothetical protein
MARKIAIIVGLGLLIVGCGPPPKPPIPTKLMLTAVSISQFVTSTVR